ncbi:hypothetical protein [Streptomyces sp. NPDC001502]|uniref:hypothetical protein n=1 Tax=Streptomyces sp. NPDC001502 TaxID=3364578 RepID=UPI00368F0480
MLLDIRMPGLDGLEVTRRLPGHPGSPHIASSPPSTSTSTSTRRSTAERPASS